MNDWKHHPKLHCWLTEPLSYDVAESLLRLANAEDVQRVAVMPDIHLANDVCIGTVLATRNRIYPAAVGGDIGCGMAALRFDASADILKDEVSAAKILGGLYRRVPSIRHAAATASAMPQELQFVPLSHPRLEKLKSRDGRVQLGTLGRGNHFLEFQADRDNQLWVMVHSGSRGMGQAINTHHLAQATIGRDRLTFFEADEPLGRDYLNDVNWAVAYAEANRRAMLRAAQGLLRELFGVFAATSSLIDRHHNHIQREQHSSEDFWVHRKGAQGLLDGEVGIVPGSMATSSYIVAGRGHDAALRSCSHGAGRRQSRSAARATISAKHLHRQMSGVWFDHRKTKTLVDEAPTAYKDVRQVMRAQRELVRITHELRPRLSFKV